MSSRGTLLEASSVTSPGEHHPVHPVGSLGAVNNPADHAQAKDGKDDHCSQRGRNDPRELTAAVPREEHRVAPLTGCRLLAATTGTAGTRRASWQFGQVTGDTLAAAGGKDRRGDDSGHYTALEEPAERGVIWASPMLWLLN